mmetsp:Transcript_43402/g.85634  ORF Transcript_43402/g.85634 Transcript_43402/m.85634 type:complete len:104 (+) Transcript_43402:1897-2208(+)
MSTVSAGKEELMRERAKRKETSFLICSSSVRVTLFLESEEERERERKFSVASLRPFLSFFPFKVFRSCLLCVPFLFTGFFRQLPSNDSRPVHSVGRIVHSFAE